MNTRLIIFGIVFLVVYNGFVATMPSQFLAPGTSSSSLTVPQVFGGIGVDDYAEIVTFTINGTDWIPLTGIIYHDFTLGGSDYRCITTPTFSYVALAKLDTFFFIVTGQESLTFTSREGVDRETSLYPTELDADFGFSESYIKYHAALPNDPAIGGDVYFGFDPDSHNLPSDAMREGELAFFMGLGLSESYLSLNPFVVISMILTLRLPNVPTLLLFLINSPTYVILVVIVLDILMEMKKV